MFRPAWAVDEVPRLQRALLSFDQQQRLAGENEKVLLLVLLVVPARRLARLHHAEVDPELREAHVALESGVCAEDALEPAAVARVEDEPALALRRKAGAYALERSFRNHARILQGMEGLAELHTHLGASVASD